jgi:D-glycero-D-manno-heptose 1,7-bisphosphate phosphatase
MMIWKSSQSEGRQYERALFVDRDGVLNHRVVGGYVISPDQLALIEGAARLVRLGHDAGAAVVVVTNQAGIGRGLMSEGDLALVHGRLISLLTDLGAPIDAIYACPHHPDAPDPAYRTCSCRKPAPGLVLRATADFGIDLSRSCLVGDQETDMQAAAAAGLPLDRRFCTDPDGLVSILPSVEAALY